MLRKRFILKRKQPEGNHPEALQSEWTLFRKIFLRLGIVLAVLLAMYFWGLAIISNIDTFWRTVSLSSSNQIINPAKGVAPLPPRINSLPIATKEAALIVSGYADPGLVLKLFVNDIEAGSLVADKEGTFAFEGVPLIEGDNKLYVKGVSGDGIESRPSRTLSVAYRKKSPLLSIKEPLDRQSYNQKESEISLSGMTEPSVTVRINDYQVVVDDQGNFKSLYSLKEGENRLTIEAEDIAGNKTTIYRTVYFNRIF